MSASQPDPMHGHLPKQYGNVHREEDRDTKELNEGLGRRGWAEEPAAKRADTELRPTRPDSEVPRVTPRSRRFPSGPMPEATSEVGVE
jgi:hypothetical protein